MNNAQPDRQGIDGVLRLVDGRELGYTEYGDPHGRPIIYCHGLPSSRFEGELVHSAARKSGIRLIAIDRPGVGRSDFLADRTLLDWPADVEAVADHLGLQRFAVLGVSGGAPYAAVCAWKIPQRVSKVGIVAGLGPPNTPGRWADMPLFARFVLNLAGRWPGLLHVSLVFLVPGIKLFLLLLYRYFSQTLSDADRHVLRHSRVETTLRKTFHEATCQGPSGIRRELMIAAQPWNFALSEIKVPAFLWHGEADHMVPIRFGKFVSSELPHCRSRFVPEQGHYSLPFLHTEEIFSAVAGDGERLATE